MISVVIPTLNAGGRLGLCLEALTGAAIDAVVKEVVVVDAGSTDQTRAIAEGFGAKILTAPPGRGGQLRVGAEAARRGDWLLFLHGDTVLAPDWEREACDFIANGEGAAVFTLNFDATSLAPRLVAAGAMLRTHLFKSPYGDQGLLISRRLYDAIGGYRPMPLFEDVDIVRRLVAAEGRGALAVLKSTATTSAARYERHGYLRQVAKNAWLLARYYAGASPEKLAADYR